MNELPGNADGLCKITVRTIQEHSTTRVQRDDTGDPEAPSIQCTGSQHGKDSARIHGNPFVGPLSLVTCAWCQENPVIQREERQGATEAMEHDSPEFSSHYSNHWWALPSLLLSLHEIPLTADKYLRRVLKQEPASVLTAFTVT